ncbi:PA2928 family protein [Pseudoxanthomonas sp. PXM02]|uniref:PA2928 family protein n=1 Tax=Pseudoxanthomonas sp. PXM02 TaxID=2769294 RepID=UPI00178108BD|nr:PA2928 family protein [Pseudoxanthomonas sp. PXM02]MBD9478843.1 hypothetical protein [Pseudoxanthomonas sp. PXM02]
MTRCRTILLAIFVLLMLSACTTSHLDPPEVAGRPALVDDAGTPRLWVLTKQEEQRQVSVRGSTLNSGRFRIDTFFHFDLQAIDPETARPLWKERLLTIGDDKAQGTRPSRVIGSSAEGRLLGQDGAVVWLLLDNEPWAVGAADGKPLANGEGLEQRNPALKGLLPSESKFYGFDRGLVLTAADARPFVIRGPDLKAVPYAPTPVPVAPPELKSNGSPRIVPLRPPIGDVPARLVELDGRRIGLYSEKEARDAADDTFGDHLRYPYSIDNEGVQARRMFWNANTVATQRFDERFDRFTDFTPVDGAPGFLNGRFVKVHGTDDAVLLDQPAGVLVWHNTRIDNRGRLAVTRLDTGLKARWTTELPISETPHSPSIGYWLLPGRLLVMGAAESLDDGVTSWKTHVVTLSLADGSSATWGLQD